MLSVRIPATSANLGPGFDALGMALDLWNTFHLVEGTPGEPPESEGERLFQSAVAAVARYAGREAPTLRLRVDAEVPAGRGLGASATVVLAGILLADAMLGTALSRAEMLALAAEIEGHPDNVAPALFGGITISWLYPGGVGCHRIQPPDGLVASLAIPETTMATRQSRGYLPQSVPLGDAVFNVARAALFVASMHDGRFDLLREATRDRLHQPYRAPLLPGFEAVVERALADGAYGAFLSGSGPTVLALASPEEGWHVAEGMADAFRQAGVACRTMVVAPADRGAEVKNDD